MARAERVRAERGRAEGRRLANEVLAVVLAAVAVLMLLALLTYHPQDLSWSSAGPEHAPSNLIGRFGAYLSDSFLQLFGLASFLIPILFAVIAYRALFGAHSGLPVAKSVGAGLLLIAISGFLALFPQIGLSVLKNARNGGVVGFLVENVLAQVMNTAGAAIILVSASLLTLMLTMEVSLASGWETLVVFSRSLRHHGQPTTSSEESKPGIPERKAVTGRPNPIVAAFARLGSWWTSRTEIRRERQRQRSVTRNLRESEARELPEDADDGIVSRARPLSRSDRNRASKSDQGANGGADPGRTLPTSPGPVMPQSPIVGAEALEDADLDVDGVVSRAHPIVSKRADVPAIGTQEVQQSSQSQALPAPGSSSRQEAQEAIRARNARRLQEPEDRDITMDPDVAEMVSTASIVRTIPGPIVPGAGSGAPAEKTERRKVPPRGAAESTYKLPPLDLMEPPIGHHEQAEEELRERATILAEKCKEFSVTGHIHRINPGPVVTTFEFKPDPGVKYSRVVSLADDLCLALKAESIRIDRIPGKSTVGIEVPNAKREMIHLREVIESSKFQKSDTRLAIALGKTINGEEYVADLAKMPHLLIAGATGAGKSVTLNAIICSILYKASAEDVKLIMVDPKRLELGLYEGIPHLLTPIVTEPKRAANALKWAVNEMENRYRELAKFGVRNIDQYNRHIRENPNPTLFDEDPNAPKQLPYIVITIDELADLMMIARADVETSIARLAQMARAVGIHLVVATQRPSVDVITGVIKANFPSRIAFRVSSKVDSRTIIDANGAEGLLGQGDMLFLPPASSRLVRVHGSFVNEVEVKRITDHTRNQAQPDYNEEVTQGAQEAESGDDLGDDRDELFDEALAIVTDMGRASTSVLQRRLSIGYGRAAKLLDVMERGGFIGPTEGAKPRKVLATAYEFRERLEQKLEERAD